MPDTVFTSTLANMMKSTLNKVIDDKTDGYESRLLIPKWLDQRKMTDNYEDDLEAGGPGLASEKAEGTEIATGTIGEGYMTRYNARTFGMKLLITEETLEDNKYPMVISAAKRLKKSMLKTADIDATNMLVRMFNASYVGGDGVALGSNSHTLIGGGTFSNVMATPMSPSKVAITVATSQVRKYPGHDGITEGYEPKTIVHPTEQWAVWDGLLGSKMDPTPGAFNEINVVNQSLNLKAVGNKYWSNTTTQWVMLTDCEDSLNFRWRRKPRSRTWVDNDQEIMKYSVSARWARGWSDPRAVLCVQA